MTRAVVGLAAPAATDAALTGAKAANLARAAGSGLPVLPGLVLTTAAPDPLTPDVLTELHEGWRGLGGDGAPVVVRSSSTVEDAAVSSLAGQFRSVLGVRGWDAVVDAVREVLDSAGRGPAAGRMAVLVQRQLEVSIGGVLFGVDPVTGDPHLVVEAVAGSPEALVSGRATAERYVVSRSGRVRTVDGAPAWRRRGGRRPLLDHALGRALARLAADAEGVFEGPQDVEWGVDPGGRLWLLQSRPVTAVGSAVAAAGPVLGPGPVAETFPDPLRPLERELWLVPLGQGVVRALRRTRTVPERHLATSPVVTTVGGWAAVDLELFGYVPGRAARARLRLVDPRPGARRLAAAVQVGRLRAELPARTTETVSRVDAELAAVPPLTLLAQTELLDLVDTTRETLTGLHTLEVLAAALVEPAARSVAGEALRVLATGRAAGLPDASIRSTHPLVLALTPPRLGDPVPLPATPAAFRTGGTATGRPGPRELVRLRARWVQELSARCVTEFARRLVRSGAIDRVDDVAWLTLAELRTAVAGGPVPPDLAARVTPPGPVLPAHFRLTPDGRPVAA
ncbi:MAG TPA: PEP/pyruvate-binding domain-containing protein [Jiangellales bacterium]|nr:PEP/pyruvate-binding domain-containing protein [Jiangellales bacterium]